HRGCGTSTTSSRSLVSFDRRAKGHRDPFSQFRGSHDLHVRAVFQDLHYELTVIGIGALEHVAAVSLDASALLRVPVLSRDPARRARRELERCPFDLAAGKDAVAARQVFVELTPGHLLRLRLAKLGGPDGVNREAAQALAQMAVSIDVPVVAIVNEPLRRDLAFGLAVLVPVVMTNPQARALKKRHGYNAEVRGLGFSAL